MNFESFEYEYYFFLTLVIKSGSKKQIFPISSKHLYETAERGRKTVYGTHAEAFAENSSGYFNVSFSPSYM